LVAGDSGQQLLSCRDRHYGNSGRTLTQPVRQFNFNDRHRLRHTGRLQNVIGQLVNGGLAGWLLHACRKCLFQSRRRLGDRLFANIERAGHGEERMHHTLVVGQLHSVAGLS